MSSIANHLRFTHLVMLATGTPGKSFTSAACQNYLHEVTNQWENDANVRNTMTQMAETWVGMILTPAGICFETPAIRDARLQREREEQTKRAEVEYAQMKRQILGKFKELSGMIQQLDQKANKLGKPTAPYTPGNLLDFLTKE